DVVRGVDATAVAGQVLCVIGRNGVGKSTLLKLLFGFLPCRAGSVALDGREIQRLDPTERHRLGISYSPQERPVYDSLSVRENLTLMLHDRSIDRYAPYFARFAVLSHRLDQQAGTLSGGEKKLLSFTRALAENLPLVLLDEPSEGVQWENILHMAAMIEQRKAAGTTFMVVEQNLAFADCIADSYLVMDQGRVVLAGGRDTIGRAELMAHLQV
nr:ATP-binding cassette domain-containing protein [Lautropia sp.]